MDLEYYRFHLLLLDFLCFQSQRHKLFVVLQKIPQNYIFVGVGFPNPYGLRAGRPRPYDFASRFALSFYMDLNFFRSYAVDIK